MVMVFVVKQVLGMVYVMVAVPGRCPVMTPADVIEAMVGELLLHVPPGVASV
jgi:hypothetical protein